jgi:hypothetical protein
MPPLPLTLTDAGIAALRAASGTNQLEIVSVGLNASAIIVSRTLVALPGEHRRIDTIAGEAIDEFAVHMVARDDSDATYTVRAIGLYLADDTLFAVYGQADPLFEKAAVASYHQAIDLRFEGGEAGSITFGDANFLLPPATEARAGVAAIAPQPMVDDGNDHQSFISPRTLGTLLSALLATIFARRIDKTGLLTGGGALDQNRTLTVQIATAVEADGGALSNKAVVPSSLANILAASAARVSLVRRINTDGLALGGGTLATDLTVSVPAATMAQARAALAPNVALTPAALGGLARQLQPSGYFELPGGIVVQFVRHRAFIQNEPLLTVNYPMAFPNACLFAAATLFANNGNNGRDVSVHVAGNPGLASCQIKFQVAANAPIDSADGYDVLLIGY